MCWFSIHTCRHAHMHSHIHILSHSFCACVFLICAFMNAFCVCIHLWSFTLRFWYFYSWLHITNKSIYTFVHIIFLQLLLDGRLSWLMRTLWKQSMGRSLQIWEFCLWVKVALDHGKQLEDILLVQPFRMGFSWLKMWLNWFIITRFWFIIIMCHNEKHSVMIRHRTRCLSSTFIIYFYNFVLQIFMTVSLVVSLLLFFTFTILYCTSSWQCLGVELGGGGEELPYPG